MLFHITTVCIVITKDQKRTQLYNSCHYSGFLPHITFQVFVLKGVKVFLKSIDL